MGPSFTIGRFRLRFLSTPSSSSSSSPGKMLHKWQEQRATREQRSRHHERTLLRSVFYAPPGNSPLTKLIPRQSLCTLKDFWVNPLRPKPSCPRPAPRSPPPGGSPGCTTAPVFSPLFSALSALSPPLFLFQYTSRGSKTATSPIRLGRSYPGHPFPIPPSPFPAVKRTISLA